MSGSLWAPSRAISALTSLETIDFYNAGLDDKSVDVLMRATAQHSKLLSFDLQQNKISIEGLTEAVRVFKGSAQEGIKGFPANVNVAVALGLAGIGPERTELEIWADPGVVRNTHCIEVEADSARFELKIESIPSVENPRTGRIVALSVIATLRRLVQTFTVGT